MYNKITEPYDAPTLTINEGQYRLLVRHSANESIFNTREFVRKINAEILLEAVKEEYYVNMEEEMMPNYNMLITKNVFDRIQQQKQYQKLNLVFYNIFCDYEDTMKEISEAFKISEETAKNNIKRMKGVKAISGHTENTVSTSAVAMAKKMPKFEDVKGDVLKTRMILGESSPIKNYNVEEIAASVSLAVNVAEGKTLADFIKAADISFTRFEINFEEETVKIFHCYCDLPGSNPRNFQPWKYNLHEKFDKEWTFSDMKKQSFQKINVNDTAEIIEEIEEKAELVKSEKKNMEEAFGECVIGYRNSNYGHDIAKRYMESKLMLILSYILEYNVVEKEVEKKRVLKPTNNSKKKKNKQNNYKSVVFERYYYNEEKMNNIQSTQETTLLEENKKIEKEKAEIHYQTPEWEVKPHTRKLKDGRIILIEGQKRKRRKELSIAEKESEAKKEYKTLGVTNKDIEKLNKNATKK